MVAFSLIHGGSPVEQFVIMVALPLLPVSGLLRAVKNLPDKKLSSYLGKGLRVVRVDSIKFNDTDRLIYVFEQPYKNNLPSFLLESVNYEEMDISDCVVGRGSGF